MKQEEPIVHRDIKPSNEPPVVICCGGPEREDDGPRDPYADVMAGVRFDCETNR